MTAYSSRAGDAPAPAAETPTFDPSEVERFGRMAAEWWDPNGKFRPLHQLGPARLQFLRDRLSAHFRRADAPALGGGMRPLAGLTILDIGCGGGLVCEPLASLGAMVTGIDPAAETSQRPRPMHKRSD